MTLFNRNQTHKSAEKEIKLKQEVVIDSKFYFIYVIFLRVLREGSISNRSDEAKWLFISFVRINEVDSIFAHLKYYTIKKTFALKKASSFLLRNPLR